MLFKTLLLISIFVAGWVSAPPVYNAVECRYKGGVVSGNQCVIGSVKNSAPVMRPYTGEREEIAADRVCWRTVLYQAAIAPHSPLCVI